MKAAYVKIIRGNVENVIVANAERDFPPLGYALIHIPDDSLVQPDYQWDGKDGFSPPRKFVGIVKDKVTEVAVAKHYEPDPKMQVADRTLEVPHDQDVKAGYTANSDGTFTNPNPPPPVKRPELR